MKLFEKIIDLFTDDEEVVETREIEVKEQEEHKLPTFMRKKIEKDEKQKNIIEEPIIKTAKEEVISDRELVKTNSKFSFPISFDEKDFLNTNTLSRNNILNVEREHVKEKPIKELYSKNDNDKPKRFKPTPIVSPVYGVLDKNYNKEDVLEKNEKDYEMQRPSKKIDFETVRRKAFGTLSDDIKDNLLCDNCELLKEVKRVQKLEKDDLLSDMVEDVSVEEAEENYFDFGVEYETPKKTEINIGELEVEINQEIKITDHNEEESIGEKIEVKEEKELNVTDEEKEDKPLKLRSRVKAEELSDESYTEDSGEDNLELTEDLFNLIDSMYEERDD